MTIKVREEKLREALGQIDWMQILLNLLNGQETGRDGQPCFHIEHGRFCLRAKFWAGHDDIHKFISLGERYGLDVAALASPAAAEEEK
jgi:hypothetical protein